MNDIERAIECIEDLIQHFDELNFNDEHLEALEYAHTLLLCEEAGHGLHADTGRRPAGHGAGAVADGYPVDTDEEGRRMSDKKYQTRMHEVLGVESKEMFALNGDPDNPNYYLTDDGDMFLRYGTANKIIRMAHADEVFDAINHGITRRPLQEDDDGKRGLYSKYKVTRADGAPLDGDCFVLRPDRDEAAISALEAYADATNNEKLAADIREWLRTTRRPRLTEEQADQLKALVTLGYRWLVEERGGTVVAVNHEVKKGEVRWVLTNPRDSDDVVCDVHQSLSVKSLVSWSDPAPLDIVQTLRDAGVEVEG